jgi:DNA invertase Pin-like site-specific DNA recombinase
METEQRYINIGYARVSTGRQEIENQIQLLKKVDKKMVIFKDDGMHGWIPLEQREGFSKLWEYVLEHEKHIKAIYSFEISRLGRTMLEILNLIKDFEDKGIQVVSLSDNESFIKDISNPLIRDLLMGMITFMNQMEIERNRERTMAGIDRYKREHNGQWGRPKKPEVDWNKVRGWRQKGLTWTQIAFKLDMDYMTLFRKKKAAGFKEEEDNGN